MAHAATVALLGEHLANSLCFGAEVSFVHLGSVAYLLTLRLLSFAVGSKAPYSTCV